MRRATAVLILTVAIVACSRTHHPETATGTPNSALTQKEIAGVAVDNAYDAVQRLRPTFLRVHTVSSHGNEYPVLFIDGIRRGDPTIMRTVRANEVVSIRYLSALDATTRYGMNIAGGVIELITIRR
jgi:hypothetical protein